MVRKAYLAAKRNAMKELWTDICSIYVRRAEARADAADTFAEVCIAENAPCRVSYGAGKAAKMKGGAAEIRQQVKLFLSNDICVPPGSRICVERGGQERMYRASAEAMRYTAHQEIEMELMDRWA